jgi:para-aminobenzoate synthetase component I
MNLQDTIKSMNYFGKHRIPFIFIINYKMDNCMVMPPDEAIEYGILFDFNGYRNYSENQMPKPVTILDYEPVAYEQFLKAFLAVQKELNAGNSYLVNLTFPTRIKIKGTLREFFFFNSATHRLLYRDEFVVFSPEYFVRIMNGKIFTYPMKGTIDASIKHAREIILDDQKEKAEHATIVDLLRNDISRVAKKVSVDRYRYIDLIKSNKHNLLQVSSEISGSLPDNYDKHLGDIITSLLPAGSVTGAPKQKTLEIISQVETYDRGFYTGVAGFYDGKKLESCVLIRFIQHDNAHYYYKSGGGVTFMSNAAKEYRELNEKIYVPSG